MNEEGEPIDWFILYKIPKLEQSIDEILSSGYGYAYITDDSLITDKDWTHSDIPIDDPDSLFGQTISPVIKGKKKPSISYIVYNDETPEKTSGTTAHSKGIFAFDSNGGFWLSHSTPKFPDFKKAYNYPKTGIKFGQTAICVSLDSEDTQSLESIASDILNMKPNVYELKIENDLIQKSELFAKLKEKTWFKNNKTIHNTINSKNGVNFVAFSKSKLFQEDIYSGVIARYFKDDLLVQTWRNGAGGKLESDCKDKYHVQNIKRIFIPMIGIPMSRTVEWPYTEDHSKWAITSEETGQSYTCISDINRVKSQFKRGGGSLCINSKDVWDIFKKSVQEIEGCTILGRNKPLKTNIKTTKTKEVIPKTKTQKPIVRKSKTLKPRSFRSITTKSGTQSPESEETTEE